jgi:arsenite methyltransferase
MTSALQFDEATSRRVERTYMTPDVVEQRRAVRAALGLTPGEHVLDIGCGPGFLAAEMGDTVGPQGSVHGIDPSPPMLAIAADRSAAAPLTFEPGSATALPLADASIDVVTATQVYEYVPDMTTALAEVRRVLRPGGRLLVLDTDWDSLVWHSTDPGRMRRVLAAWDEHLTDPYLPRRLGRLLRDAGFTVTGISVLPMLNAGYREDTFSANVIGLVAGFVPGRGGITQPDADAWAADLRGLGDDYFFSLNRYLFLATKAASPSA